MENTTYKYNNLSYTFTAVSADCVRLEWYNTDCHFNKCVKVVDDYDYTFKLLKTQIKARGGASGLVEFIDRCLSEDLGVCWVHKIIDWIIEDCKAYSN
jgi:hypothetical protein